MPLWLVLQQLEQHGHIIHYLTTTPSIRTLTQFLQRKKISTIPLVSPRKIKREKIKNQDFNSVTDTSISYYARTL